MQLQTIASVVMKRQMARVQRRLFALIVVALASGLLAPPVSRAHHLLALTVGHVQTHLMRAVARLRLAELLQDGPQPLAVLAEATSTDASALARIMRARTDLGLVAEPAIGQLTCQ